MIGYVCKYTPVEVLESMGIQCERIEPESSNFEISDSLTHPNMCSYSKAVLEHCLKAHYDGIILPDCCDSIRRLYDILKSQNASNFIYLLSIPRKNNESSCRLFLNNISGLISSCEKNFNTKFQIDKLIEKINGQKADDTYEADEKGIILTGARCQSTTIDIIKNTNTKILHNYTCNGRINHFKGQPENKDDVLLWYASSLLNQFPCMRMADISKRYETIKSDIKNVSGIIHHTVKFCDYYSYDYANIIKDSKIPVLKVETDYSKQCEGQIKTRVEAFVETIGGAKVQKADNTRKSGITAGIDSGSLSTNAVILDKNKKILSYSIVLTGAKSIDSSYKAYEEALESAGLKKEDVDYIVSTGYGRSAIPFSDRHVTEITCHGKGAHFINGNVRTIIDIGGQDSKVIRLDDKGEVTDFAMNDKCAAGTGRFLEMMSKTLEIPLSKMGEESQKAHEEIAITSMCTVFAESEVVSLIAQNKNKADILMGLNNSIASKVASLLNRIGKQEIYMMTGGVAKNIGVVHAIEKKIGAKVLTPPEPQIVGALGAALIAQEIINKD